jgi:hypothetical protein
MKCTVNVTGMGPTKKLYKIMIRESQMKRAIGKHRRRWEDNIRGTGCKSMDCIRLAKIGSSREIL